jgi:hypothetical protein
VDEARAYLPRLRMLLASLRSHVEVAARARTNGHGPATDSAAALAELESGGIVLRQLDRGLVDFPARLVDGTVVLLCWQVDEEDVAWWHLPEAGFAGRRPLPLPDGR